MKDYFKLFLIVYFVTNLVSIILAAIVFRQTGHLYPFMRIAIGNLIVSAFVSFAIWLFKLEKGYSILNIILGYLVLIPPMFILRNVYGNYLFRFSWLVYIVMIVVGIIYGIAVYVVSKKQQKDAKDLNQLLNKEEDKKE